MNDVTTWAEPCMLMSFPNCDSGCSWRIPPVLLSQGGGNGGKRRQMLKYVTCPILKWVEYVTCFKGLLSIKEEFQVWLF